MSRFNKVLIVLVGLIAGACIAVLVAVTFMPQQTEKVFGDIKVSMDKLATGDELSHVTLGPEGGKRALDNAAEGEFVELTSYRIPDVPPVYAAHNNRGGDVMLWWEIGQHVSVTDSSGVTGTYEVVEERFTPKWAELESLQGMKGPIVLQTCFYGEDRMRFVSLKPVTS